MSQEKSEKSKRGHRIGMTITGGVLLASSLAAAYVAFLHTSSDLPGWLYRFAPSRGGPAGLPSNAPRGSSKVAWRAWSPEALKEAEASDRLVLLDLSAFWCGPCRDMDESTYADPQIASWIAANLVAVRVDADERPDLALKYRSQGWPTTALLLPSGEVISAGTFVPRDSFMAWARQSVEAYRKSRASMLEARDLARHRAKQERSERASRPEPAVGRIGRDIDRIYAEVMARFDRKNGGFGGPNKFPLSEPLRFLVALRSSYKKDPRLQEALDSTLKGEARLQDPVWGGFYRYSGSPDWSEPKGEKLLKVQAELIEDFLTAYAVTGNEEHRRTAERALGYVRRFLEAKGGGFYSSQAPAPEAYYRMSEQARLDQGPPETDRRIFAAANAEAIAAYLQAGSNLQRPELTARALKALDLYLKKGLRAGAVAHELGRREPSGFLEDQTAMARACAIAFRESGKAAYLQAAVDMMEFARTRLAGDGALRAALPEAGLPEPALDPMGTLRAAEVWLLVDDATGDKHVPARLKPLWSWLAANEDLLDPPAYGRLAEKILERNP